MEARKVIEKLMESRSLSEEEYLALLYCTHDEDAYLRENARATALRVFGTEVKARGLIEISNYCKNNCLYCGIRAGNARAERYRLTKEEIMECCRQGYGLGFKTFVLQGGEDSTHTAEWVEDVVRSIRTAYPETAITLSLGEREREDYQRWFDAGADRYLLRHETIDREHYSRLHPASMSHDRRIECLKNLKEIGYETGTGIMVGSPYQLTEHIAADLKFIEGLQPDMVGIGPFVPHRDTPFRDRPAGSVEMTLKLISILRLMLPTANIPATTSLGTLAGDGREQGILAGANVVMPNLSPAEQRRKYALYDNKICTGEEAAESRSLLEARIAEAGYRLVCTEETGQYSTVTSMRSVRICSRPVSRSPVSRRCTSQ